MTTARDNRTQTVLLRVKTVFKWFLTVASVGFLVYFLVDNAAEFPKLIEVWRARGKQGWTVFALIACYVMSWLIVAAQFYFPLRRVSPRIGFFENGALIIGGALLNYSPFKAGVLYRFYYLKKWHGVSYATLAGLQLVRILLTIGAAAFVGLSVLAIRYFESGQYDVGFITLCGIAVACGIAPFFLPMRLLGHYSGPLAHVVHELARGIRDLRENPMMGMVLLVLIGCQFAVLLGQYGIIFTILKLDPPLLAYLILIPLITMLSMVSITPGNLGLREFITASALSLSNVSFNSGMFVGLVDRGALLVATMVFGTASLVYLAARRRDCRCD